MTLKLNIIWKHLRTERRLFTVVYYPQSSQRRYFKNMSQIMSLPCSKLPLASHHRRNPETINHGLPGPIELFLFFHSPLHPLSPSTPASGLCYQNWTRIALENSKPILFMNTNVSKTSGDWILQWVKRIMLYGLMRLISEMSTWFYIRKITIIIYWVRLSG